MQDMVPSGSAVSSFYIIFLACRKGIWNRYSFELIFIAKKAEKLRSIVATAAIGIDVLVF